MPNRHLSNPIVTSIPPVFSRKDTKVMVDLTASALGSGFFDRSTHAHR